MSELSAQEITFCEHYLKTNNATESYFTAGYKGKGHVAESTACRLLKKAEVAEYIASRKAEIEKQLQINTIADIAEIAETLTDIIRDENNRLSDKLKAMELLGKHHKMFTDKVEQTNEGTLTIVIEESDVDWLKDDE